MGKTPGPISAHAELLFEQAKCADEIAIKAALKAFNGNVGAAAKMLEVQRRTLDRRINALGLREWLTTTYPHSMRQPKRGGG